VAEIRVANKGCFVVNAGETTWAGLASEIFAPSAAAGGSSATVEAIPASDYPTPTRRPSNSRLSTAKLTRDYGIAPRPWQAAVAEIVPVPALPTANAPAAVAEIVQTLGVLKPAQTQTHVIPLGYMCLPQCRAVRGVLQALIRDAA